MEPGVVTKRLRIGGMTCVSCQTKIERKLRNTAGIKSVAVSYRAGTADVSYDTDVISLRDVIAVIERLDYKVLIGNARAQPKLSRVVGMLGIIVSLYALLQQFGILNLLVPSQLADTKMGYGMLFVIGLMTSIHCVAMCGGIHLSQCIPRGELPAEQKSRFSTFRPSFFYNLGRVISYTVIGGILGFAGFLLGGGADAGLSAMAQGILKIVAGVLMVIMGINLLGLFPWLRALNPRMPKIFGRKVGAESAGSRGPLIVGLFNGLMPCGPLQSMQIVALASGNPFAGALSMFLFSLGTVPLMLGLGSIVSVLGKKFTQKVMSVGAVMVVVLGLAMLSQGGSLSGLLPPHLLLPVILALCAAGVVSCIPFRKPSYQAMGAVAALGLTFVVLTSWGRLSAALGGGIGAASDGEIQIVDGRQVINSTLSSGRYPNITVQAGIPVKWVIDAPGGSINGCNNRMLIGDYGIEYSFQPGENVIEFTPVETGTVQYSCWMGMIRGTITVVEAGADPVSAGSAASGAGGSESPPVQANPEQPVPAGVPIPTESVAVAELTAEKEYGRDIQEVKIELTDDGFRPAILVVQAGGSVRWTITNSASGAENGTQLLVPAYATQLFLEKGENPLYFSPRDSFDFSTGDHAYYGYVKVVDDINHVDVEAIKQEVSAFETLIYPPEAFRAAGSGASCH